jgi:hypothetical protein
LVERLRALVDLHRQLFAHHLFASSMATVPLGIIQDVCTAIGRPDLVLVLITGLGYVDSAAPSMAMWELGRMVVAAPELTAAFDDGVDQLLDRLERSGSQAAQQFLRAFAAFIHDYRSRGPNEWEARSPTWETCPQFALSAIEWMRLAPESASPTRQQAERVRQRQTAAAELLAAVAGDPRAHAQDTGPVEREDDVNVEPRRGVAIARTVPILDAPVRLVEPLDRWARCGHLDRRRLAGC